MINELNSMNSMNRMDLDEFFGFIKDERKGDYRNLIHKVFSFNPKDVLGHPSSFTVVVICGVSPDSIFCGVSKYNPEDASTGQPSLSPDFPEQMKKQMQRKEEALKFSPNEGLRIACNRAWKEFVGAKSDYGKGHNPKPKAKLWTPSVRDMRYALLEFVSRFNAQRVIAPEYRVHRAAIQAPKKILGKISDANPVAEGKK